MFIDRAASTVIGDGANAFISDWNKITATVRNIDFTFEINERNYNHFGMNNDLINNARVFEKGR